MKFSTMLQIVLGVIADRVDFLKAKFPIVSCMASTHYPVGQVGYQAIPAAAYHLALVRLETLANMLPISKITATSYANTIEKLLEVISDSVPRLIVMVGRYPQTVGQLEAEDVVKYLPVLDGNWLNYFHPAGDNNHAFKYDLITNIIGLVNMVLATPPNTFTQTPVPMPPFRPMPQPTMYGGPGYYNPEAPDPEGQFESIKTLMSEHQFLLAILENYGMDEYGLQKQLDAKDITPTEYMHKHSELVRSLAEKAKTKAAENRLVLTEPSISLFAAYAVFSIVERRALSMLVQVADYIAMATNQTPWTPGGDVAARDFIKALVPMIEV